MMAFERTVVGATGHDGRSAQQTARRLRDQGHEVVFVGPGQTPEQLVRAAVAEDAQRIVADADADTLSRVAQLCAQTGAEDIRVEPVDVT
jgi:methylmalonyl-CoA mutase C-terminal domain/subunit